MSSLNAGLSLLSRGIGEERCRAGQKKLEVCLEPEDYHNITPRRFYLPPLNQHAWPNTTPAFRKKVVSTHKTFTTRKGALLLYAEDLALTSNEQLLQPVEKTKALEAEDTNLFNTFDDLRSAILSYGDNNSQQTSSTGVYLGFVHHKHSFKTPRNVRPGLSAKRYLSNWTKSWDDTVLNDLRTKGHIWDKNLFQHNSLDSNLKRRINDDLSRVPGPYRLTRNMLMAPAAAGSYEFYRVRPQTQESGRPSEVESRNTLPEVPTATPNPGTIAAIVRDKDNKPHAVVYSDLKKDIQQEILQRLLMQSALNKQQQLMENSSAMKALSVKSQYGSRDVTPMDVVTAVNDIDIGIAIETLVSGNSINLLEGGEQVYDDHQLTEVYKSYFTNNNNNNSAPSSAPSTRRSHPKSSSSQKVSFPHRPTLPPIKKSSSIRRSLKPSNAQLPLIKMEPATPKQPKKGLTGSRLSASSYTTTGVESVRSSSGNWPSEESNTWGGGEIDEDALLNQQQQYTESVTAQDTEYDGDAEGPYEDGALSSSKLKSSSMQSLASSKHSVVSSKHSLAAGSTKHSVAGSVRNSLPGSTKNSIAGSTKNSIAGSNAGSIAGSVRHSVAASEHASVAGSTKHSVKAISKSGSAVSLGSASMVLEGSNHLSKSLDSLNLIDSSEQGMTDSILKTSSLKGSIRGSVVPQNRKESMRSYKGGSTGGSRSGSSADGGAVFAGPDVMLIGSSVRGASGKASVVSDVLDNLRVHTAEPDYETPKPVQVPQVNQDQDQPAPVVTTIKLDEAGTQSPVKLPAVKVDSPIENVPDINLDEGVAKPVETLVNQDDDIAKLVEMVVNQDNDIPKPVETVVNPDEDVAKPVKVLVNQDEDGAKLVEVLINPDLNDDTTSEKSARDDVMSRDSGLISEDEAPEPITDPTSATEPPVEQPPGSPVQTKSHGGSLAGSVQELPVAQLGMGLPDVAPSIDDHVSVVKSRKTHSQPSVSGSVKSLQDLPQGDMDITASFHIISYGSSNNSRKNSLNSADEDVLPIDDTKQTSGAESDTDWPNQPQGGAKQTSESEQDDLGTGTESELETGDDTDVKKLDSRASESGMLSIASGSVRSAFSASVLERSRHQTPASQLIELEEHAAAVAAAVLQQRPQSGRDLALDAQIASDLWTKKLSELFVKTEVPIERSKSAIVERRRNSLDSVGSQGDEGDVLGRWNGPSFLAPKPQIRKSRRKRRVHSAKAAVRFLKDLLKKDSGATNENSNIQLAPEILDMISNKAESVYADDIAIVEDHGTLIIRSRAPSAASMVESANPLSRQQGGDLSRLSSAELSERAISAVASENIPDIVVQTESDEDEDSDSPPPPRHESESDDEMEIPDGDMKDDLDIADVQLRMPSVARVPSVAELQQLLEEKAEKDDPSSHSEIDPSVKGSDAASIHSRISSVAEEQASSHHGDSSHGDSDAQTTEGAAGEEISSGPPAGAGMGGGGFSLDVTNIGKAEKKEAEKQALVVRAPPPVTDKPAIPPEAVEETEAPPEAVEETKAEEDAALQQIIKDTGLLQKGKKSSKSSKSSKSGKSAKSTSSKEGDEDSKSKKEKEEFVVGRPPSDKADNLLYKPLPEPPPKTQDVPVQDKAVKKKTKAKPAPKKTKKKTKKAKPKEEEKSVEEPPIEVEPEPVPEPTPPPPPPAEEEETPDLDSEDEFDDESETRETPESPEFIIIEDEFSSTDEDEPQPPPDMDSPTPTEDIESSEFMSTITEDSTADGPKSISNQQAKAAKRAAEKERRRLQVEKKRQEREESRRKALEKAELQEQLKKDYEEAKRRKEEEIRLRRERQEAEIKDAAAAEIERKRQAALAAEKERRQQDAYKAKMEGMARRKREEDLKRKEEEERKRKEEEERRKAEEAMMAEMEEAERLAYEKQKREEELEAAKRYELDRRRREHEAMVAQHEAERLALEKARQQKELEKRLKFNRDLQSESNVMAHSQDITPMFTWSYFELLDHLGIAIPEELREQYEQEKANNVHDD